MDSFSYTLDGFPLLADLSADDVRRLIEGAPRYDVPHGDVLFRQGERCASLHLIVKGQIKLFVQTARGDEKVIALVSAPGSLGEMALLLRRPYVMTAEATADSHVVELPGDTVLSHLHSNVNFMRSVLQAICTRLNQRTRDLESFLLLNGTQRVTGFLLSQLPPQTSVRGLATVTLPAKKSIIASQLNLTQEHFSRILRDIQTAGLIEVSGRQIRVVDVARLRSYYHPRPRARRTQK